VLHAGLTAMAMAMATPPADDAMRQ
jgi:hypothetical protein